MNKTVECSNFLQPFPQIFNILHFIIRFSESFTCIFFGKLDFVIHLDNTINKILILTILSHNGLQFYDNILNIWTLIHLQERCNWIYKIVQFIILLLYLF